jgi:60 kDa SS-A/Ro ribonucleoprotein
MARINQNNSGSGPRTHEGGPAVAPRGNLAALRRSVCACLLWEDQFYEDGQAIADRIVEQAKLCKPEDVAALAVEAREQMGLRHAPLLLTLSLFGRPEPVKGARQAVARVVRRADELAELLAMYWRNGRKPIPRAMLRGLADAFGKFDEYQLAKYDRPNAVKLRDVLRLARPKPANPEQADLWGRLRRGELKTPDTWEVQLSGGADKKETFERLLRDGKLGYLALLRNLRNMASAQVDDKLVRDAIVARKGARGVFPFRYIAAERAAPGFSVPLDAALQAQIGEEVPLTGLTVMLVDVSGSMSAKLSAKSDMTRMDAAAALASVIPAEQLRVFSFSNELVEVPARRGLAGVDAVINSQRHGGTALGAAIREVKRRIPKCDRLIVVTDEQSHDSVGSGHAPAGRNYMINVASYRNGVGFGDWVRIDGFSEGVIRFIRENELVAERKVTQLTTEPELADA